MMPLYSLLLHPLPGTHLFQGGPAHAQAGGLFRSAEADNYNYIIVVFNYFCHLGKKNHLFSVALVFYRLPQSQLYLLWQVTVFVWF